MSLSGNHGGIVVFSNTGRLVIPLSYRSDIKDVIKDIPYPGGNTNTTGGLYVVRTQLFTYEQGDRPDAANVAIIITDGKSTYDTVNTIPFALNLQKDGVRIFTIGITESVNVDEIKMMASPPRIENQNYFLSPDFHELEIILEELLLQNCITEPDVQ